jgi:hypothetical protein
MNRTSNLPRNMAVGLIFIAIIMLLVAPSALALPGVRSFAAGGDPFVTASDGLSGDEFGYSLALDGSILAVGAYNDTVNGKSNQGSVYIYYRDANSASGWSEITKVIASDGNAFHQFGAAVALDGDTLVVGAIGVDNGGGVQSGQVYMFRRHYGGLDNWGQFKLLTPSLAGTTDQFGGALALDGTRLAVAASGADPGGVIGRGAVFIFEKDHGGDNNWGESEMLYRTASLQNDNFGSAVAMAGDLLVVGAESADVTGLYENDGAVFIFEQNPTRGTGWTEIKELNASDADPNDKFGDSLALDEDQILVGAWAATVNSQILAGKAYLFDQNQGGSDNWGEVKKLTASDSTLLTYFGSSVALEDGQAYVGAHGALSAGIDTGALYEFEEDWGGQSQWGQVNKYGDDSLDNDDLFGFAVVAQGSNLLIGAYGHSAGTGAVFPIIEKPPPKTSYLPMVIDPIIVDFLTLNPGGIVTSPDGLIVGAPLGALSGPIEVFIEPEPAPLQPLPYNTTSLSGFYLIGGKEALRLPAAENLTLAFPVPQGADTTRLAIAAQGEPPDLSDNDGTTYSWDLLPGFYDSANEQYIVALGALEYSGRVFALVENPDFDLSSALAQSPRSSATVDFVILCLGFTDPSFCTNAQANAVENELVLAHDGFAQALIGYDPPRLHQLINSASNTNIVLSPSYVAALVQVGADCKALGAYNAGYKTIKICMDPAQGVTQTVLDTVWHEYFHALEYAYLATFLNVSGEEDFIIEGLAEAAVHSLLEMDHSGYFTPRPIDVPLTHVDASKQYEYQAQDFWVFWGQWDPSTGGSSGMDKWIDVFDQGADVDAIVDSQGEQEFKDAFFMWVRNQVWVKEIDFSGDLGPACSLLTSVLVEPIPLGSDDNSYTTPEGDGIPPLTGQVVQFELTESNMGYINVNPAEWSADFPVDDLRYTIFRLGDGGCENVPEGLRDDVSVGRYYAVIANTNQYEDLGVHVYYVEQDIPTTPIPPP